MVLSIKKLTDPLKTKEILNFNSNANLELVIEAVMLIFYINIQKPDLNVGVSTDSNGPTVVCIVWVSTGIQR